MWGLWFFPLVKLSFYAGLGLAVLWYLLRAGGGKRPKAPLAAAVVVAVPFGCAALPGIALTLAAVVGSLIQKSDSQLYKEVFGQAPVVGEDRMLFNDSGSGAHREIFMCAEPTGAERDKMLALIPLRPSPWTLDRFVALGTARGFSWWISSDPRRTDRCQSARIREAHGFRGWREFRVAECLDGGTDVPPEMHIRYVFVMASGRQ